MFKSVFDRFSTDPIFAFLIVIPVAAALGLLASLTYLYYRRKAVFTRDMPVLLIILPPVVAVLIGLTNLRSAEISAIVTGGLILTGLFALTRFRSDPLPVIDLTYVVIASVIGMGCGLGYVAYCSIAVLLILALTLAVSRLNYGQVGRRVMSCRILVPEDFNYEGAFEPVLEKYCLRHCLIRTKTTDGGQLFELKYTLTLKKNAKQKEFIDAIRVINGNLDVFLTSAALES